MDPAHPGLSPDGVLPQPIEIGMSVSQLIDRAFLGSTAGKLRSIARLLAEQVFARPETVVGVTVDAAIVQAGLGTSVLSPLLEGGYIDWMAISGPNVWSDALRALGDPRATDAEQNGREANAAGATASLREILAQPDFQSLMGTAELYHRLGAHLRPREKTIGVEHPSLLTTASSLAVPMYNPAPGDSPLGSLLADLALVGNRLAVDPSIDLNEAAAILNEARHRKVPCAVICLGRGAAASFMLGAPPHLHAIITVDEPCRYGVRIRMAGRAHRPPEGPPSQTPGSDIALSVDLSVALPLLTAYVLDRVPPRQPKRLYDARNSLIDRLRRDRFEATIRR